MGFLSWIKGGTEDKTARWLREKIDDAVKQRDGIGLASACAALAGAGTMVFGLIVPTPLADRDALRDRAFEGMRKLLVDLPDDQCDPVFDIITRAHLLIDVEPRRTRLTESREGAAAELREILIERIGECSLEHLLAAATSLRHRERRVLGTEVPPGARDELLALALARLEAWLPKLDDDEAELALARIRRGGLTIDVGDRADVLATRRREQRAQQIAQASGSEPRNESLEQAIVEHPDDAEAYSVLADWLQREGHPRGELIASQLRAETDPDLEAAVTDLLATHEAALLGPLAMFERTREDDDREAFEWRRGFIHHARMSYDENSEATPLQTPLAEVLAMLLEHPSGRLLAELDIGLNGDHTEQTLDVLIAVLATYRPAHLRRLLLGDFTQEQCEISWFQVGNVAPLWTALPNLRHLVIHGGSFELGTIEHAGLERLEVQTGGLAPLSARALAVARLPKLRHLDIWYGSPNYGGDATIDDVTPLLRRTDLPELEHLGLMNSNFTDDICAALAGTPVVARLRELDLSMGTMSDQGARALRPAAFPKLERLDVSHSYLSADAVTALGAAFPSVIASKQRANVDDERYPGVGE